MYRSFHVSVMWWASLDEGIYLPTCQSNPSSSCIPFSREKEIMQRAPLLKPPSGQRGTSCDAYGVDMMRGWKGMWILFCFPCICPPHSPPCSSPHFQLIDISGRFIYRVMVRASEERSISTVFMYGLRKLKLVERKKKSVSSVSVMDS